MKPSKRRVLARVARNRLMMSGPQFSYQELHHNGAIATVMGVDPDVVAFGGNYGFSDGSVLAPRMRWGKVGNGHSGWLWIWSAYDL